ncbi:MAG: DUF11 domain-containing protein, partial [Ottowia sp.]|nr:DUF11 domain-containing protein [Ottowia sp.]
TNGVTGSYTITVTNNGDAPYTATTFTVGEQLPAGLTYTGVTAGSGLSSAGCSAVVGNVPLLCTLTLSSNLAVNGTASFTLQVTPIATFNGGDNYAGVCTGSTCTTDCKGTLPLPANCIKAATPNLVITKTSPAGGFTNGVTGSYTITVTNNGDAPYTATTFTVGEQLPAGLTYTGVTAGSGLSSAGCSSVVGNVPLLCTLTLSSNLAVNATASFTLQVTPIATFNGGDNYAGVCTGSTCTTDCRGTLPLPANCVKATAPNLVITKTAPAGGFTVGVPGSYTLTVTNNGDANYTLATAVVGDQLPTGMTYTGATAGTGLSSVACSAVVGTVPLQCTLTFSGGLLAVGASASFTLQVTPNNTFTGASNYAGVCTGSTCTTDCKGTIPLPANCTNTLTPNLVVTKAAPAGGFTVGVTGEYTLVVTNSGTAALSGVATVGEQLPAGLIYTSATAVSGLAAAPVCTTSGGTVPLQCTLTFSGGTLAAGASASFKLQVTPNATFNGGDNYAGVCTGSTCTTDCRGAGTLPANCIKATAPNLVITKTAPTGGFTLGVQGDYTFVISNNGTASFNGVATVGEQLPAGMTYVGATAGSGMSNLVCQTVSSSVAPLQCSFTLSNLAANSGQASFTLQVYPTASFAGGDNYAGVCPGASCNTDCRNITPLPTSCTTAHTTVTGLSVTKANPAPDVTGGFTVGAPSDYTVTVQNTGTLTYPGGTTLLVGESLPTGFVYNSVSTTDSNVQTVSCGPPIVPPSGWSLGCTVTLASGFTFVQNASISFKLNVTPSIPVSGAVNYAGVCVGSSCTPPPQPTCITTPTFPGCGKSPPATPDSPQLTVSKVANRKSGEIGDVVVYTVTVQNNGTHPAESASFVDTLPAGFRYINGTMLKNQVLIADPVGSPGPQLITYMGEVRPGTTITFSYKVRIGVGAQQGDGLNQARATVGGINISNVARVKVLIEGGVFTDQACVIGKVFVDCNGDGMQDVGDPGVPCARLYMEDGTYFITDAAGKFSFCGISPRTHVLKLDLSTMPHGSQLGVTSNRNAHDPGSLFLDVKRGELIRADFMETSCTPHILEQIRTASCLPQPRRPAKPRPPEPMPEIIVERAPAVEPAPPVVEFTLSVDALFDFDKSVIKPAGKIHLDDFVEQLKGHTFDMIAITGHTDWIGTHEYNQKLSMRRAMAVDHYLSAKGLDVQRLYVQGKGKTQPVADNRTAEGRAKNRRVVVELITKHTEPHVPVPSNEEKP